VNIWQRQRTNILLAVAALLLATVVLWDRTQVTTDEAAARKYNLFDAWRSDTLESIEAKSGGHRYHLTRGHDADGTRPWDLRYDDAAADADPQAVSGLLLTLEYADFERRVTDDSPALGLATPTLYLALKMRGLRYTLRIGAPAPAPAGGYYAQVDGGARGTSRFVIAGELKTSLETGLADLRARELVPYVSSELEAIEVVSKAGRYRLTRAAWPGRVSAGFMLDDPAGPMRANRRVVEALLVALGRFELSRVVDTPATGPSELTLTFSPRDKKRPAAIIAVFGRGPCEQGQRMVSRSSPDPLHGCADAKNIRSLSLGPTKMIDTFAFGARGSDVIEILAEAGAAKLEIARKGRGWIMRQPRAGKTDAVAAGEWLEKLLSVEGTPLAPSEAADEAALGLDPPASRLALRSLAGAPDADGKNPPRIETVDVGAVINGFVHLKRHDDGRVLRLAAAAAGALASDPARLRSREISDVPLKDVAALDLDCGGRLQELTRGATGDWSLLQPKVAGMSADIGLASELADALRKLQAVRWTVLSPRALANPWCTLGLRFKSGKGQPLRIELHEVAEGGYVARQLSPESAKGLTFVAPKRLGRLADQWLLDRSALLIDITRLRRVELRAGSDKAVTLTRQSGRWLRDGAQADATGAIVSDGLKGLVAETVWAPSVEPANFEPTVLTLELFLDDDSRRRIDIGVRKLWRGSKTRHVRMHDAPASFLVDEARLLPLIDVL
jgi:hypothetical protein